MKSKRCSVCHTRKSIDEYAANPTKPDGYNCACKTCKKEKRLRRRNKDELHTFKHTCRNAARRIKRGYRKGTECCNILGASTEIVQMHLNSFLPAGKTFRDEDVSIDHFFPLGAAKTIRHMRILAHYTNLRAIPAHLDQKKTDNMPYRICSETGAVIPFLEEDLEYILENFDTLEPIRKILTGEPHETYSMEPPETVLRNPDSFLRPQTYSTGKNPFDLPAWL